MSQPSLSPVTVTQSIEDHMAPTRKSAKRTTGKKRRGAKRASARKSPARKTASKRRTKAGGTRARKKTGLKRTAEKGLRAAREGLDTVREAGGKTWKVFKSTTAQVVDGVRDKLGDNPGRDPTYP
jgi:hypothetical protein